MSPTTRTVPTEMNAFEFSRACAEGKLRAEEIEISIYKFMKFAEKKGHDEALAPLFKRHGALATALVTGEISAAEQVELQSIRRALDVIEAAEMQVRR